MDRDDVVSELSVHPCIIIHVSDQKNYEFLFCCNKHENQKWVLRGTIFHKLNQFDVAVPESVLQKLDCVWYSSNI